MGCCIPGCKEYTRIRVFDPSWIEIPKQVFRNFKLKQRHTNFICVDHFDDGNWSFPSLNKLIEYRNGYLKRFLTENTEEEDRNDNNEMIRISDTKNTPEKQISKKLKLDHGKFYSTPEKLPGFPDPLRTSTPYSKP